MYNDFHHKKYSITTVSSRHLDTTFSPCSLHALYTIQWEQAFTKYSLYRSSDKVGMICKWILPDSSVYYAVTLVSSDAVWLLSHLTVKKGSWVRGMDCAVSALVTQIVRTLQRNKCIFNCSCIEGMWNPFPLRETAKRRGYGSSVSKSLDTMLCVNRSKGQMMSLCVSHKTAWRQSLHIDTSYSSLQHVIQFSWKEKRSKKHGFETFVKKQTGTDFTVPSHVAVTLIIENFRVKKNPGTCCSF